MTPQPLNPETAARSLTHLPSALFVGCVCDPLKEEVTALAEDLDPQLARVQLDLARTLELCHAENEPSAGRLKEDVDAVRSEGLRRAGENRSVPRRTAPLQHSCGPWKVVLHRDNLEFHSSSWTR